MITNKIPYHRYRLVMASERAKYAPHATGNDTLYPWERLSIKTDNFKKCL